MSMPTLAELPTPALAERRFASTPITAAPLTPGVVQLRQVAGGTALHDYYLYVPRSTPRSPRLFVTVHGISRNAREHIRRFAPFAEQHGVVVVAPRFPADRYPDYQRLGRLGRGEQAGAALRVITADAARLTTADAQQLYLFGYSGGAQFVHRFAMAYPASVARYVVAAAGWYTFPDDELRYPRGIKRSRAQGQLRFRAARFLAVPALVLVGERDNTAHGTLRESAALIAQQGSSRVERAQNWVQAMRAAAAAHGLATAFEFQLLAASRHLFKQCMKRGDMGRKVFDFLFADEARA